MPVAYTARYVFPVTQPPLENGVVVVNAGRIASVGREVPAGVAVVDLNRTNSTDAGGAALLPGLVNSHCHLEFSHCHAPLGKPGMAFPDWIRSVILHRQQSDPDPIKRQEDVKAAVLDGLLECVNYGTKAIGEIATTDWPWEILAEPDRGMQGESAGDQHRSHVTIFHEFLGLAEDRFIEIDQQLADFDQRLSSSATCWKGGVSPHAPYSTHWRVVEALCNYSQEHAAPLAMHLGESREELELLQTHGGPFRELLDDLGVWNPAAIRLGSRSLDYLQQLAQADRSLIIHGNYLDDKEIQFVSARHQRMSIVYCPRTHAYFQHDTYPLEKMLAAGVNVSLGTDSRASNPDLNLLAEIRHVAKQFPEVPCETVLRLGTINGAMALGLDHDFGTLDPGKRADFAVVALPDKSGEPHRLLFDINDARRNY